VTEVNVKQAVVVTKPTKPQFIRESKAKANKTNEYQGTSF
jgi:hypothetical protein